MGQQHAIHKFVLGTKDFDDKQSEFMYDRGWYSITDIVGEEKKYHLQVKKCPGGIS